LPMSQEQVFCLLFRGTLSSLQTGSVDDLVVNNELAATIIDHEGADTALALSKGVADAGEQVTLVNDTEALLDVAGLGHGGDPAILTEIKDTIGLVDGTEHALDHDRGRRVRHETGLLVELAGEDIDTKVAVLTCLGGDADADDLAWAALEDQQITNADEVARDSDGVWRMASTGAHNADLLAHAATDGHWEFFLMDLVAVATFVVGEGVEDAVGSALNAAAEGVVVAVVVVVTHFASRRSFNNGFARGRDVDVGLETGGRSFVGVNAGGNSLYRTARRRLDVDVVNVAPRSKLERRLGGAVVVDVVDGAAADRVESRSGTIVRVYVVNSAVADFVLSSVSRVSASSVFTFSYVDLALNWWPRVVVSLTR
jgi:hypothetical protein